MSAALIEKMRAKRQRVVDVGGHQFTIRRPTPMEAMDWLGNLDAATTKSWFDDHFTLKSASWRDAAWQAVQRFVDGWDLKESDLIPGGTPEPVPFSLDIFNEYLKETPVVLNGLAVDIFTLWLLHLQQVEDEEKKPETGSVENT